MLSSCAAPSGPTLFIQNALPARKYPHAVNSSAMFGAPNMWLHMIQYLDASLRNCSCYMHQCLHPNRCSSSNLVYRDLNKEGRENPVRRC